ncbi:MAG: GIY-YIG nuclease family protein [Bacteroidetes bacterium]|nr:GIY-YIG nuclease family protein [Bacteroidota bacterium]
MYKVYILHSKKINKYYVGSTQDLNDRLKRHNEGRSVYTKKGLPWELMQHFDCMTKSEAVQLENKIKKRGMKRYLEDINRGVAQSG